MFNAYTSKSQGPNRFHTYSVAITYPLPSYGFQIASCIFFLIQPLAATPSAACSATPMTSASEQEKEMLLLLPKLFSSSMKIPHGLLFKSNILSVQEMIFSWEVSLLMDTFSKVQQTTSSLLSLECLAGLPVMSRYLESLNFQE